jgi:DNA-binding transcriptional MerR regulator
METEAILTVEALAAEVGLSVRNIRAYQAGGLVDPPERRGRIGYYGPRHVARLELIRELRERGFGLDGIRRLVEQSPSTSPDDLEAFAALVADAFTGETPTMVHPSELAEGWGDQVTPEAAARTLASGLYNALPDGTIEVVSPTIEAAGQELARLGVPLEVALDLLERQQQMTRELAEEYTGAFVEHVARPLIDGDRLLDLDEAIAQIRPLATRATLAAMTLALKEASREAAERELDRLRKREP